MTAAPGRATPSASLAAAASAAREDDGRRERSPRRSRPRQAASATRRGEPRTACDSGLLSRRERAEVAVHLGLVLGRRLVVDAGGQAVARVLLLQPLREARFDLVERGGELFRQLLPAGEVLLETFGARRRQRHPLAFEGAAGAA